jgi:DNA-binding NarL/FixJ family response regulator
VRVLVVGDVRVSREELARAMVRADRRIDASASPCVTEVAEKTALGEVDALIVDMTAARAMLVVEQVAARHPNVKIVALAAPEDGDVIRCAEAGVSAFLPADSSIDDVLAALRTVEQGDSFCPPGVAATLLRRLREIGRTTSVDGSPLTARELEIVRLLELGLTNKEIARQLSIALPTVKNHVHHILEKLGVERRAEAAGRLRKTG